MKKQIWSIIMTLALILTTTPTSVFSAQTQNTTISTVDSFLDNEGTQNINTNTISSLVFRWCSADGGGNLREDENGNYIPIMSREAETTLNMFLNSEELIFIYLKNAETNVETQVDFEDLQSSDSSVITISKEKGATLIVVSPTAKVGDMATIDYVIDGKMYSLPVRIISRGFESQLVIRDPDFDANNHPVENIENSTFVGIGDTINTYHTYFFYYIDAEGTETRLDISQLTSSNSDIVKLSKDPFNADAVRIEFVNFGSASVDYIVDGKKHSVKFDVMLPNVGLYTSINVTEANYIDKFFISSDEENVFYLVAKNEYRITRAELNGDLDAIADIELDESGAFAKITVTGTSSSIAWYEITYDVINIEYDYEFSSLQRVQVLNNSQLMYREAYNDFLQSAIWECENSCRELFFYYVDKTGIETKVPASQLKTSDPNVVRISENTLNSDVAHLEFVGEGDATITYTIDDVTYSLEVSVSAYSPYVDFFDIPDMVNGECFWTYEVTDEEDTFYLVVEDGWKFTEVTLLDEFANIADVQIDTTNGNYATIKVTGVPKNQEYDLKYVVQNIDDPESTDFNFRFILLINSKSACAHTDTHIVNAKQATCEEVGYTGDEVCLDCEEVVKEGIVIPATGHNYVDGECENCGELVGWHKAEDGNWYFYTEGEVDTTVNGVVANGDEYWYAVNGKADFTITTVAPYGEEWWYVENGKVNFGYTGLAQNEYGWWYTENGILNWNYTGLVQHYDAWFYVNGGQLDWSYTGLVQYNGIWFYVQGGQLNWGYTGLVLHYDTWFYVQNGALNWDYTGLVQHYDAWFYVEGGQLNWGYTGLVQYNGIWFYVQNGQLNWGYTGLAEHYGAWFYVEGGMLNWNYTGLVQHYDAWFYVNGGQLDWSYTGLCEHCGFWFYIEGGQLNWGYTGTVYYNGTWWRVENGIVVGAA